MMSVYQMWVSGHLNMAIQHGIIKNSIVFYLKVYHQYIQERNIGHNYTKAVQLTAERMPTTEITVKRAIAIVG